MKPAAFVSGEAGNSDFNDYRIPLPSASLTIFRLEKLNGNEIKLNKIQKNEINSLIKMCQRSRRQSFEMISYFSGFLDRNSQKNSWSRWLRLF